MLLVQLSTRGNIMRYTIHRNSFGVLAVLATVGLQTQACRKKTEAPARSEQTDSVAPRASTSHPQATPQASYALRGRSSCPPTTVPCKAQGKSGQHSLGTQQGGALFGMLRAWGDSIYSLSTVRASGRVTLYAFKRDGSGKKKLGSFVGMGEPTDMHMAVDAAYVTHKRKLWRFSLGGGNAQRVADNFGAPLAINDSFVYSVQCHKDKQDKLVRVHVGADNVGVVATIPRKKRKCDYRGVAISGKHAFVADWSGRRVIRVGLDDGIVKELALKVAFPKDIFVQGDTVDFGSSTGLMRVARAGEKARSLVHAKHQDEGVGKTPFMTITADASDYWVMQGRPYESPEWVWRVRRSDGKATKALKCPRKKHIEDNGRIQSIGVDDQCLYYSVQSEKFFVVYARRKPE